MGKPKPKKPVTLAGKVYDLKSRDLPINAVVAPLKIVDPFGDPAEVLQNLRDDPLAGMKARYQIDQAQYEAGRKWQYLTELTEIGNVKAIDPTKEAVDGGRFPEMFSERAGRARRDLEHAHAMLGDADEALVKDILGKRMAIKDAAAIRFRTTPREVDYIGQRFRDALNILAVVFGCATR